ncbi:hypothetical protein D9M71_759320 [compost metagenome]
MIRFVSAFRDPRLIENRQTHVLAECYASISKLPKLVGHLSCETLRCALEVRRQILCRHVTHSFNDGIDNGCGRAEFAGPSFDAAYLHNMLDKTLSGGFQRRV